MKLSRLTLLAAAVATTVGALADETSNFKAHRYDHFQGLPTVEGQIVFAGNSITNQHSWFEAFGASQDVIARGVGSGYATEILDNLESYIDNKPAKFFLMIGTNDIGHAKSGNRAEGIDSIAARRIETIVQRIRLESPKTRVYVQTILPRGNGAGPEYESCNTYVKEWVAALNDSMVSVINLSGPMAEVANGGLWSMDRLHVRPKGYSTWCHYIENEVGHPTIYPAPETITSGSNTGGMPGNYGGRIEQFSYFPIQEGDALFFGDTHVTGCEWHEILRSSHIKDRGAYWNWGGANLSQGRQIVRAAIQDQAVKPAKIFIFYGIGGTDAANYRLIIDEAKSQAPEAEIYCVALPPSTDSAIDAVRVSFNETVREAAAEKGATFVDIYTPLAENLNANIMWTNYPSGRGYVVMANALAPYLEGVNPVSIAEYDSVYTARANRQIIGRALTKGLMNIDRTEGDTRASLQSAIDAAVAIVNNPDLTAEQAQSAADAITSVTDELLLPKFSTADETHWYAIRSARENRVIQVSAAAAGRLTGGTKTPVATTNGRNIWKLEMRPDRTFNIVTFDGRFINPDAKDNSAVKASVEEPAAGWELTPVGIAEGYYAITSGTATQLNQTNNSLSYAIYNWHGSDFPNTSDTGCLFEFVEYSGTLPEAEEDAIEEITVAAPADNSLYDLQGRVAVRPRRGLYISNGRKTVIR